MKLARRGNFGEAIDELIGDVVGMIKLWRCVGCNNIVSEGGVTVWAMQRGCA